jgi:hypothetical protein
MKSWFTKLLISFGALLLIGTFAFSQTTTSSMRSIDEAAEAAFESKRGCRGLLAALGKGLPEEMEHGFYEIPPICWAEPIKALKPVKLYSCGLNVAIVLNVRNGVEEGIYIYNFLSSYMPRPGEINSNGFEFIQQKGGTYISFRRKEQLPRFEDYPVTTVYRGNPASPKIVTSSDKLDMEKIRNGVEKGTGVFHGSEEKKGPNFAGCFTLITWSCGSSCLRMAIVDSKSGDIFSPPDAGNCIADFNLPNLTYAGQAPRNPELQFRLDSNLLIIKNNARTSLPYTSYYLWQENRWTLLRRAPLLSPE